MMVLAVDASASTAILDDFSDQLTTMLSGKVGALGIAGVVIASAIMAWKNATWGPLAWGAVAAVAIGAASEMGVGLAAISL